MNIFIISASVGLAMALAAGAAATATGLDRERALYPVVVIVIASLYGMFAAELPFIAAFVGAALLGFKCAMPGSRPGGRCSAWLTMSRQRFTWPGC